jgi:hypothetical protein
MIVQQLFQEVIRFRASFGSHHLGQHCTIQPFGLPDLQHTVDVVLAAMVPPAQRYLTIGHLV